MKKYQKLNRFPLGSLQPKALKEQLIRNKKKNGRSFGRTGRT